MTEGTQIKIDKHIESRGKGSISKNRFPFDCDEPEQPPQIRNAQRVSRKPKQINEPIRFIPHECTMVHVTPYVPKPESIPEAIRQIDKKIREYKKVMEKELKEKMIKEQLEIIRKNELNALNEDEQRKAYDFLTNPQLMTLQQPEEPPQEQAEEQPESQMPQQLAQHSQTQSYSEAAKKREKIYEQTITRMYERRQNPAFFAKLKKKPPVLNITAKNKIAKGGSRMDPDEHRLRVYNRENVPVVPELIIPCFTVKKDAMAQSILAYLKHYTPLIRGYKNFEYPKCVKNILQEELDSIQKE